MWIFLEQSIFRHMVTVEVTMWFFVVTYSVETICDKMGK